MNKNFSSNPERSHTPATIQGLCKSIKDALPAKYSTIYNNVMKAIRENTSGTLDDKRIKALLFFSELSAKYKEHNGDFTVIEHMLPGFVARVANSKRMIGSLLRHTEELDLAHIPEKIQQIKNGVHTAPEKPIEKPLEKRGVEQQQIFSQEILHNLTLDRKTAYKNQYDIDDEFPMVKTNIMPGHIKEFPNLTAGVR